MKSICGFVPSKDLTGNIKTANFVYETDFHKLEQPFYYPINYIFLVVSGKGTLKLDGNEFPLKKGALFFSFPQFFYEIDASADFQYIYISFLGDRVQEVLKTLNVTEQNPVFYDYNHLIPFWNNAIIRFNANNANFLTESVLLYTFSFMTDGAESPAGKTDSENAFDLIIYYIDNHYTEPDISLKKLSGIFSYTEKYLSTLFKTKMTIGFSSYINQLRVQYSIKLIENGITSVSHLSATCGYNDTSYFSKVFKKKTGFTPVEYMKRREKNKKAN